MFSGLGILRFLGISLARLGFIEVSAPSVASASSTLLRRLIITSTADPRAQYITLQSDRYIVENVFRSSVYHVKLEAHEGDVCKATTDLSICVFGPPDAPVLKIDAIAPSQAKLKWNHPQTYPRYSFITKYLLLENNVVVCL